MEKKRCVVLLVGEIIVLTVVLVFSSGDGGGWLSIASFPLKQIGSVLRTLSLSGSVGNVFAIVIYVAICLLPCALPCKKKFHLEDALRPLLSLCLFFVLYKMINTGDDLIFKAILGACTCSIIVAFFVFKLVRKMILSHNIYNYLSALLVLAGAVLVATIFQNIDTEVISLLNNMQISNNANTDLFSINTFFIIFSFVINNLPYVFNVVVIFVILDFINCFKLEAYSDKCINIAKNLSKICIASLVSCLGCLLAFNITQIFFFEDLFNVNVSVDIPVFSVIFILACLICTRLIQENKELTDDKNSII